MNKMNPEVKAKWLDALRSGKYEQGFRALCSSGKYCCLGVLADLYVKEHPETAHWDEHRPFVELGVAITDDECTERGISYPPAAVYQWAGLTGTPVVIINEQQRPVDRHNDSEECSFAVIADAIEQQL